MAKWKVPSTGTGSLSGCIENAGPARDPQDVSDVGAGLTGHALLEAVDLEIDFVARRAAALKKRRLEVQDAIRSHDTGYEDGA